MEGWGGDSDVGSLYVGKTWLNGALYTGSLVGILLFGLELFVCGRRMLFSSEEELGTP